MPRPAGIPPKPRNGNKPQRSQRGRFVAGVSGNPGGGAGVARRRLNLATIETMHRLFEEGGEVALRKVMVQQPAQFAKLLVLLVPRELEVTHSGGVKAMTDEQLEAGILAIRQMLESRESRASGDSAVVIEGTASPVLPQPVGEGDPPTTPTA